MAEDATLFETMRTQLSTAVIGDVLDRGGLRHQFLPPAIRPLTPEHVLVGRAMTVLEADCFGEPVAEGATPGPFGLMLRALDDLRPGEIYIATGGSPRYALWGGLMSARAQALGAVGAVLDGYHRDTREILALGFPVFSLGAYAQDQRSRGRVIDFRCPIDLPGAVRVTPGDVIMGDIDGVLVIPAANLAEVVAEALAKARGEEAVRARIARGDATEVIFDQTGIM